jgi:hypothetical protein
LEKKLKDILSGDNFSSVEGAIKAITEEINFLREFVF